MLQGRSALLLVTACVGIAATASAQAPLYEIRVTGNDQLRAADIIAASGLRKGQSATRDDFDAANQKLFETGLFTSVNYRYAAKIQGNIPGFSLTLEVAEEPAGTQVIVDIPGVDESKFWQDMARTDPFVRPQMPQNARAAAYYQHAIENWLRAHNRQDQIVMKDESDLSRGTMAVVFVPANLPKIGEVVFAGNETLDNDTLQRALVNVAPGQDYTDRMFRRMIELNLRPLYEEKGHLTVSFPHIAIADPAAATSAINVDINEGPSWTLGKVELTGDGLPIDPLKKAAQFPEGKLANWKQIQACIGKMEALLRRDGYLNATSSKPERAFHEKESVVDLTIQVRRGQQFLFAALQIDGFSPDLEQKARKLWKLAQGAPMDAAYPNEYVRSMLDSLHVQVKSISTSLHIRPGTNLVDVVLNFE